jgi:tRNA(Ile)-lysidine synthase
MMFHDYSPVKVVSDREDNGTGQAGKVVGGLTDAVSRRLAQLPPGHRVLLAVSGGADSIALLDAVARCAPERIAAVATFDHRSGTHSGAAVDLVVRSARARSLPVITGAATTPMPDASEAGWRAVRWQFLRRVAREQNTQYVATGHSRDDQVETVCMRLLRGAGARGLAGLDIDNDVVRPLLACSRSLLRGYVAELALPTVDDPSNVDRRTLRARVRHDILPAIEASQPGFQEWLLALGARSATWRRQVETWAATLHIEQVDDASLLVPVGLVQSVDSEGLGVLWPAILARIRLVADRRGTERLTRFTSTGEPGRIIQLAGGGSVRRLRDAFLISANRPMDDVTP